MLSGIRHHVVKITPAHDPNDFEIGLRHDLEMINHEPDATLMKMVENTPVLTAEARKQVVRDLEELGLLVRLSPTIITWVPVTAAIPLLSQE